MKKVGNEKTELKLQKKYTLSDNWNTYDPFGEAFFFAAGPFFKQFVFLTQAFAFGCGFFICDKALLLSWRSISSGISFP